MVDADNHSHIALALKVALKRNIYQLIKTFQNNVNCIYLEEASYFRVPVRHLLYCSILLVLSQNLDARVECHRRFVDSSSAVVWLYARKID